MCSLCLFNSSAILRADMSNMVTMNSSALPASSLSGVLTICAEKEPAILTVSFNKNKKAFPNVKDEHPSCCGGMFVCKEWAPER